MGDGDVLATGAGPGFAEGARSAPRLRLTVLYGGGASQILRRGWLRPAPRRSLGVNMASALGRLRKQQLLTAHAHRMRSAPSEPERVLWQALRANQLGVPFRRQVVLLGYIVDFFAPSARLVVEVDGAQHAQQRGADKRRDRALSVAGLRVLRLPAALVIGNLPRALQLIAQALCG